MGYALAKRQGVRLVITPAQIETLITEGESKISRAFAEILASLRERRSAAEIDALIQSGQADELERLLRAAFAYMGNVAVEMQQKASAATSAGLSSATGKRIQYDVTGPDVVSEMARRRRALIDDAVERQLRVYGDLSTNREGKTRKMRQKAIIRATGLSPRDVEYIASYRDALKAGQKAAYDRAFHDKRYKRPGKGKRPRTEAEIDRMVMAYERKLTNRRIKDAAEAEALRSFNEGQHLAMEQAQNNGDITASQRGMRWHSKGDDRVRDSHVRLNGQTIRQGEVFQGIYSTLRFPHDPQADHRETRNCRCRARPVFLKDGEGSSGVIPPAPAPKPRSAAKPAAPKPKTKPSSKPAPPPIAPKAPPAPVKPNPAPAKPAAPKPVPAQPKPTPPVADDMERVDFHRLNPTGPTARSAIAYRDDRVGAFTNRERRVLQAYKSDDYRRINDAAPDISKKDAAEAARAWEKSTADSINVASDASSVGLIDKALRRSSLAEDTALYRGIDNPDFYAMTEDAIGKAFKVENFQSTSLSRDGALKFATLNVNNKTPVLLKINGKKGAQAVDMDQFAMGPGHVAREREVLLPRGSKYVIKSVSEIGDTGSDRIAKVIEVDLL